ncbi:DUF4906 domain-containing protein [Phocaeicola barnesiae]|uniref:DUF4906 domain-containing protein n=1 Tax=Phocaeicola barnesiae TaxID=376804 RepID=UPI0025A4853C|nr:DUF4906 domain-containing protein [Phocaeicola barnesiae]MDM8309288.1 DUF4906 domain-containing protein [Phocaeicola barnesiae]
MKDKLTKYILLCLLACIGTGCEQTDTLSNAEIGKEVKVRFSLGMLPAEGTGTRASAPHVPEVENLIYDIWVLQFNENGILLDTETKYYPREGESGLFVENFKATLIEAQNSTVCLVVNTNDPKISWPNNFPAFQRMLLDVQASNELSRRDRMPMCGYWQGNVTEDGQVLSALLCRMMTRINLVVNNQTGAALDGTVALENVPTKAYVYPRINQEALPDNAYTTSEDFSDRFTSIASGDSQEFYYYIAPNICSGEDHATKVTVTSGDETWSVTLGTSAPDESDRIYTLYANNYYTFTLNLK